MDVKNNIKKYIVTYKSFMMMAIMADISIEKLE